jgi:hypothetical protein
MDDVARLDARLDHELVVHRYELEDDVAGTDDAAWRILIELDDDAARAREC